MKNFDAIDAARRAAGLTKKAVCDRAEVDFETWRRIERGINSPIARTLEKLGRAVDQLTEERQAAE